MAEQNEGQELQIDTANLYREDTFTDLRVGSIRRLVPVTPDGEDDDTRSVRYEGQASMMTPAGTLPLNFELEGDSLSAAIEQFPTAVNQAAERAIEELRELQREQSSRIQVPGQGGGGGMGGPQGGAGGQGGLQF